MQNPSFFQVKVAKTSLIDMNYVVFLRREGDERMLPIVIGALEAQSVAGCYHSQKFSRPLSHDLFRTILQKLNATVTKVYISDLREETFHARIVVRVAEDELDFDGRPSDAIALALRYSAPIYVDKAIFEKCSINLKQAKREVEKQKHPIQKLKKALDEAIANERYEDAAKIRDKIQLIENKN